MKKILALFSAFAMITLCSCTGVSQVIQTPIPEEELISSEPVPAVETEEIKESAEIDNQIFVKIDKFQEEFKDPESGTFTILDYTVETPEVFIEGNDSAAEKINVAINEINAEYLSNENGVGTDMDYLTYMQSMAEDIYNLKSESIEDVPSQSSFARLVNLKRADNHVISFEFKNMTSMFDYEENVEIYSFDSITGESIEEETAQSYLISEVKSSGKVNVYKISNEEADVSVPVVDLVTVDDDGDNFLIFVDGEINNVKFTNVGYMDGMFIDMYDLWFCNSMKDCALQLKATLLNDSPNLRFSYETADGICNMILVSSDNDAGASFMLENAWEAVG